VEELTLCIRIFAHGGLWLSNRQSMHKDFYALPGLAERMHSAILFTLGKASRQE